MIENNREKAPYLVVELLESFSEKEIKGLQKIVSCSYFNTDRYVIKLLEVLIKKVLHQTNISQVIQLRLYNQVFSDKTQVKDELDQKQKAILRSKISSLTRLAERFLIIETLEQSDVHQYDLKLNALLKKKQYRLFSKHLKKAEIQCGNELEKMNNFEFKFKLEDCKLKYLFLTGQWLKEDNLNRLIKIVDLDYLNKRMEFTITALTFRTRKPKIDYDLSLPKLTEQEIFKQYIDLKYPYLSINMASIQLSLLGTNESYRQFFELLKKNQDFFHKEELKSYYNIALNHCARMIKKGLIRYSQEYVNLIKILDKKELLHISISLQLLKNSITNGCKIGDFKWAIYINEKYTKNMNPKFRKDVLMYNLGYIAYEQKSYLKAIDHLLEVNNFQKSYDIDKRILLIKSYYELEKHYTEPTAQLFRSIEAFVMNNKLYTDVNKKVYKNTIRIFYNLYRYKHGVGKMTLDTLQEKIEQAEYVTSKAWLLEKIEELRK